MRPKAANIAANIPAFLSKLWKIVNDPDTDHLINWSSDGCSFVIQNQAQFWYTLLPIYYKHNNMSSFIRQLNMYGFHKISSESGGVESDRDELKFYHPFFQQDQPNLMKLIKRKMASTKTSPDEKLPNVDQISKVLVDVKQLRGRQESVDNQLVAMKQENAALWQELALLRQKHMKQQQIVNKLIHFLVHIVNPNRGGLSGLGVKRRYPLMLNDARSTKSPKTEGPTIHELKTETGLADPPTKPKLNEDILENRESVATPSTSTGLHRKETDLQRANRDLLQAANEYIDINSFGTTSANADVPKQSPKRVPTERAEKPQETNREQMENDVSHVRLQSPDDGFKDDLDDHLESTQGELESIKDMLFDGYPLDASTLLGMFNADGEFPLDVPPLTTLNDKNENNEADSNHYDPMMANSELMSYNTNPPFELDFENLFEEQMPDTTMDDCHEELISLNNDQSELTTPIVIKKEPPTFPTNSGTSQCVKRLFK